MKKNIGIEINDSTLGHVHGGVQVGTAGDYNVGIDLKPLAELGKKVFKGIKKLFKDIF